MAKAKKPEASEGGATKKQATATKKTATPPVEGSAEPQGTKAAAPTTKTAASGGKTPAATGAGATKKKAAAKPGATSPAGAPAVPLIDTSLAAATAAQFVMNRALLGGGGPAGGSAAAPSTAPASANEQAEGKPEEKRESSTFKQLKAGLNKPAGGGIGGILGNANFDKKGNSVFGGGNQQTGRNQTFGADVNRAGVPRRTGG